VKLIVINLLLCTTLFGLNTNWGWDAHRYINEHAVDYLPAEMSVFVDHREFLAQHSVDPDADQLPGYYHYIDIDDYSEFFNGTLPHDLDSLIALYGSDVIEDNGIIPWIIERWTDSLAVLIAAENWDDVWQVAAELGHYVADSHQPLHLTLNYNGQLSDNYGIHSRYETKMINPRLSQLTLPTGIGKFWPNVIDSVFLYIEEIYPYVDSIMIADDLASAQDPDYNSTYYNYLWQELGPLTNISINRAILDVASVWRTAWERATNPTNLDARSETRNPRDYVLAEAYPNPFNPVTNIKFSLPASGLVSLKIYNLVGQEVAKLVSEELNSGTYTYSWNASGFSSGVYFYRLATNPRFAANSPKGSFGNKGFVQSRKLVLLK